MTIKARSKKGTLELRRRVPTKYSSVEPRKFIWVSLETDSQTVAAARAVTLWQTQIARWEAMLAGDMTEPQAKLDAARDLAAAKGFTYTPAAVLLERPVGDILHRVEAISVRKGVPSLKEAAALLGTLPDPGIRISQAMDMFWQLTASDFNGKSADQIRRARNPVNKAISNLISVIGDKRIDAITRDDMLDFREWWADRLEKEELTTNSANKDLTHIGKVLRRVNELKRLGLDLPLGGLAFKQGDADQRPPFSTEWIRTRILAPSALAGLNTEARCILDYRKEAPEWVNWETLDLPGVARWFPQGARRVCSSYIQSISLALEGKGIGLGVVPMLAREIHEGRLVPLAAPVATGNGYFLGTPAGRPRSPATVDLIGAMQAAAAGWHGGLGRVSDGSARAS